MCLLPTFTIDSKVEGHATNVFQCFRRNGEGLLYIQCGYFDCVFRCADLPNLQKALNKKLNDTTMFQSAWNVCYSHSTDVTKTLELMQETAGRVVQTQPPTAALQATNARQRPENEATPTILNAKGW